jgi:hypothetical protein
MGSNHLPIHNLFDNYNHFARRSRFIHRDSQAAPQMRVAFFIGARGMNDGNIRASRSSSADRLRT